MLFWRLADKPDSVVVGVAYDGRKYAELENIPGPLTKYLPLYCHYEERMSFCDLLERIKTIANDAYTWQEYFTWEHHQQILTQAGGKTALPFGFDFYEQPAPSHAANITLALSHWSAHSQYFKVRLVCLYRIDKLQITFHYDQALYSRADIERLAGHYVTLLSHAINQPEAAIDTVEILSAAERRHLLITLNATSSDYPENETLHRLFEKQVKATPKNVALVYIETPLDNAVSTASKLSRADRQYIETPLDNAVSTASKLSRADRQYGEQSLTYEQLNARANQLAHLLRRQGAGPEVRIGIYMERSPEMIVAMLAILKAGGAYVPLDLNYPQERLAFLLQDSHVALVLTQQQLEIGSLIPELPVLKLDALQESLAQESTENLSGAVAATNLAYIIYTSGSTGKPKGVMITHRALINYLAWCGKVYPLTAGTLLHSPIAFDLTITSLFAPLLAGQRVVLLPEKQGVETLGSLLKTYGTFSLIKLTPSHLELLKQYLSAEELAHATQALIIGGEALFAESLTPWRTHAPATRLINEYGPTEATVGCSFYEIQEADPFTGSVPIGRPIANMQLYLLDHRLAPVPIGVVGEVYIGGPGLARGYFNCPDLTAERFIPNPFVGTRFIASGMPEPGTRLYKTGDAARYLPNGNIEFVERTDSQVKLRGFRIELGEIEAILGQHPVVQTCAVLAKAGESGEKRLVAYIVPEQQRMAEQQLALEQPEVLLNQLPEQNVYNPAALAEAIQQFLKEKLPIYMLPSTFMLLDALPLTPNGKIDRRALASMQVVETQKRSYFVAPRTAIEQQLADIWNELLGLEQIGIHDNFFDLGGHSLLIARLIARLHQTLQVDLPWRSLFDAPTVAELAQMITTHAPEVSQLQTLPLQPVPHDAPLPLSFAQERIWFLQQLEPSMMSYNSQATLRFRGQLDIAALERSLKTMVERHEIFRTTFASIDGKPRQFIHPTLSIQFPVIDLVTIPIDEREAMAQQLIKAEFQIPFDLTQLPLIRWKLLRLSGQEYILVHVEHHLLHDGWSFNVLIREILELYQAFAAGQPSPLPELPIQFADFAVWQRQWMQGAIAETQLNYWKRKLIANPPLLSLPFDRPRPAVQRFRGAAQRVKLSAQLYEALKTFSHQEGATLFMVMLAAFLTLLYRYSGQEDLSIGSGIANRRWRETENLIGMIINTIVLRADAAGNPSFLEFLSRIRELTLEAYAHQDIPFDKVVEALQPERDLSRNPLFQVIFGFHDAPLPALKLPGLELELHEGLNNQSAKFDLSVIVIPYPEQRVGLNQEVRPEEITLVWEYNTDLFDASTITRMIGHYQTLLQAIVLYPTYSLNDLPLLTLAEQRQLLIEWNDTALDVQSDYIHHLVEVQAQRNPEAAAIVYGSQQLSYQELNQRANQLAHYLQKSGVGVEVVVGICLERSPELVIGLLSILKAGGVYLPLDPDYPPQRCALMLATAQATLLLTTSTLATRFAEQPVHSICVDTEQASITAQPTTKPTSALEPTNLAYIIYTSGSTGTPKGVQIPHCGLSNLVSWHQQTFKLTSSDRATQLASVSFDAFGWEIWPYLATGATVYIVEDEIRTAPLQLRDWLVEHEITISFLPTPLAESLLDEEWLAQLALRTLLIGGDTLRRVPAKPLPFPLVNNYGPTENTVVATSGVISTAQQEPGKPHIGCPIANTHVYVLDQQMQPVPIGVAGELYIGGAGLARGYQGRPDLTAERFLPNPFINQPGARLYKTGDIVRYRADGKLDFLGRNDQQIKIRGFRIELGEIEIALCQHPAIKEAVVIPHESGSGNKRLIAYIVLAPEQQLEQAELHPFLRARLPEYMLPTLFIRLDALPLLPNGKIDRQALPSPDEHEKAPEKAYVAPRSPLEETLAHIWEQVLGVERVGIYDNFFEVGGHSLLATQVISRVRDVLQTELAVRHLFEAPTVAGLAMSLVQHYAEQEEHELLAQLLQEMQDLPEEEVHAQLVRQLSAPEKEGGHS
jgi:amino acid adenylation domain-containing protein